MSNHEIINHVLHFLYGKTTVMIGDYMSTKLNLEPKKVYQILELLEEDGLIKCREKYMVADLTLKGEELVENSKTL